MAGITRVSETIPQLREPGTVITLPGTGQLLQLESVIGATIIRNVTKTGQWSGFENEFTESWKARRSLPDMLKGDKFHGRLLDIELVAMDNPIEQLVASEKARSGLSGMGGSDLFGRVVDDAKLVRADRYGYGFHLRAQRQSSVRRSELAPVAADVWYVPKSSTPRVAQLGGIMQRMVRTSAWSNEQFDEHMGKKSTTKRTYEELTLR